MYTNVRNLCSQKLYILEKKSYFCICIFLHELMQCEISRESKK